MSALLAQFEVPWFVWLCAGLFLGGLLFNATFRSECDKFLAELMGLAEKRGKK